MMILRYPGAEYSHGSVKYAIGSTVMATDQSPIKGCSAPLSRSAMAKTGKPKMKHLTSIVPSTHP